MIAGKMTQTTAPASLPLQPFVDQYTFREADFGHKRVYNPLPARSNCFLTFYLGDRYTVFQVATRRVFVVPARLALVGPQDSRREDMIYTGRLRVFTIQFTPIGLLSLFGIPARLIRNSAHHAEDVIGPSLSELEERLAEASGFVECAQITNYFLEKTLRQRILPSGSSKVARIAGMLKATYGGAEIRALADRYGLSVRQVERSFQEYVGVSPKTYGRLARLQRALELNKLDSSASWAMIASEAGYFDQAHLIRDFRDLTGETPAGFVALSHNQPRCQSNRS